MKFLTVVMFILNILTTAYEGLVFKILWGWFISPTFGLPELSYWIALGIVLTIEVATMKTPHVALLEYQLTRIKEQRLIELGLTKLLMSVMAATIVLVLGFFIQLVA